MTKHEKIMQMLAVYDDLDVAERTRVDAHLAACADCAARLSAYRAMDSQIQQLPRLQPEPTFRQEFYTQMESNMSNHTRKKQMHRIPALAIQLLVVGAIILLGISFWASLRTQDVPLSAPAPPATVTAPTPVVTAPQFSISEVMLTQQTYAPGNTLYLLVSWQNLQAEGSEALALHLMDEAGQLLAQMDMPLTADPPTATPSYYGLKLPDDLENGRYTLTLMVYDPVSSARLPVDYRGQETETVIVPQAVNVGLEPSATPVSEAPVIHLESWSPDSQYLLFREYSEAEHLNGDVGAQRMYDVAADQFCPHALVVKPEPVENWLAWIDAHTFAYISAGDQLIVRDACDISETTRYETTGAIFAILGQSHDLQTLLLQTSTGLALMSSDTGREIPLQIPADEAVSNARFSPNDQLLALTNNQGRLWLVDSNDGSVILSGNFPNPIWLSNDELLISTLPADATAPALPTPFIVNLEGDITQLTTLFTTAIDETTQHILAASDVERGSYTILLTTDPQLGESVPVRVYHSATGEVETLPYSDIWADGLTENGRYLLMIAEANKSNGEPSYDYVVRETTAVGEDFELFMTMDGSPNPDISPGDYLLINTLHKGIFVDTSSYPVLKQAPQWTEVLSSLNRRDILWSPDTENVAVVGDTEGMPSQLFILPSE